MKLKAGIIGLGVGESHIKGYEDHKDCEVVALCDFSEDRVTAVKEQYPSLKIAQEAEEILADPEINVVSIASYDNFHYDQIIKALNNDKHVFVEKPLCLHENEAREIRALLNKKPQLKISSNLILRKCPRFQWLKNQIDQGAFGELFHIEGDYNYGRFHKITEGWRGKMDYYSVVIGGGVHIIDLLLWLSGENIVEVSAYGNNIASQDSQFQYNDSVTAVLKFESGLTGKVSCQFGCVMPHFHNLNVYGTQGTFINTPEEGLHYKSSEADQAPVKVKEEYPGVHKGDLLRGFVESILLNSANEVTQDEVFKAMSVCFAIEKAVGKGPVKVEYI